MVARRFLILLTVLGLGAAPREASADTKIAVVDMQGAMMQTEDGLRAQATIKKFFDRRQQELDRRQEQLKRERGELERQARVLSRRSLQRRMEHWQRRMVEVQTLFVEYNRELQKKQAEMTQPIIRKMFGVVRRIARRRGIDVVVDKTAVPYARPDLNLTDMVVQMYNTGGGGDADAEAAPDDAKPPEKDAPKSP